MGTDQIAGRSLTFILYFEEVRCGYRVFGFSSVNLANIGGRPIFAGPSPDACSYLSPMWSSASGWVYLHPMRSLEANRISREMSPLAISCSGSERETVRACTDIERCARYHGYTKLESPEIVIFLKTFYVNCGFNKTVRSAGRRPGESCCSFKRSARTILAGWKALQSGGAHTGGSTKFLAPVHMRKCILKWDLRLLGSDRGSVHSDHPQFGCGSFGLRVDPHL